MDIDRGVRPTGSRQLVSFALLTAWLLCAPLAALAQDPENCLSCHRFRGLSRLDTDTGELRLFFCSAEYYMHRQGAHARLRCTDCHERSEVRVIPHKVETRVDCTRTCHITPAATGTALQFSHQRVADSIARSSHAPEKLEGLFDPPLLHAGQSQCLYCHDQPVFGLAHGVPEGFLDHSGGTRCDTCHREELPLEVEYFANHVAARMKPARSIRQLAQVCAVCHSDKKIVERFDGHDAVASYLHSFHGKASLLGSHDTATCVACHSTEAGDQHMMLPADDPDSSINPVQLPDTCRTTECHPGYPPEMSNAAVHLELDPNKRTPEWYVAAFFILMTATVMAVFFLLVILELLSAALRRSDSEHHRLARLAGMIQAHPQGRRLLERTTVHQRYQHWILVVSFAVLVITGMPLKFAEAEWAHTLAYLCGGVSVARLFHRIAGVVLIAIFLYHIVHLLVLLVLQIRADRKQGIRVPLWKRIVFSPMMLTPTDAVQFIQLMAHLVGLRKRRPAFGRYNFAEKFEYWAVFWGVPIMGLSGLALWGMPWVVEWLPGRVMNFAFIIHSDEAYLAFIYIAAIHLFSVIFAPAVFPLSLGTLTGQAPAAEWVENHRGQLEEIARELDVTPPKDAHTPAGGITQAGELIRNLALRVYSAALAGAYAILAFVSLRFLILMLITRATAPVEIVDIPKRLDADAFFAGALAPIEHSADLEHRSRGPLAHFHQVPQWFEPDPRDTCATSGCHTPLPHGQRIEVRAFLNMHATFVDCMVCHAEERPDTARGRWFSLPDRELRDTPAILRAAARLENQTRADIDDAAGFNAELVQLLQEALPASGNDVQLQDWLLRLETTYPGSKVWSRLIDELRGKIQAHVRGEYAAKIGLYVGQRRIGEPGAEQRRATADFLNAPGDMTEARRQELLDTVHTGVHSVGAMCTPCHSQDPTLIEISKLGYPESRVRALRDSQIMRSVLTIEAGQPFYLPLDTESEHE